MVGETVVREHDATSCVLRIQGNWLLLITCGRPTAQKPGLPLHHPADSGRVSREMTCRVPDCGHADETLGAGDACFLTPPLESAPGIGAVFCDPDGSLRRDQRGAVNAPSMGAFFVASEGAAAALTGLPFGGNRTDEPGQIFRRSASFGYSTWMIAAAALFDAVSGEAPAHFGKLDSSKRAPGSARCRALLSDQNGSRTNGRLRTDERFNLVTPTRFHSYGSSELPNIGVDRADS